MQEHYISKDKRILVTISYRNERAMKFEKFVSQFVKSVNKLEKRERVLHNSDIIKLIWKKTMNPELSQYLTALKVQFQHFPRPYQEIIQEIASQVPLLANNNFCQTSEISTMLESEKEGKYPKT